ncbi:hypothetical protein B0H11DRAFT_1917558 [Mycena galericulata]|nr:hypothetical protein B0H11DRAFT_1917558 [Mycena galericulata]
MRTAAYASTKEWIKNKSGRRPQEQFESAAVGTAESAESKEFLNPPTREFIHKSAQKVRFTANQPEDKVDKYEIQGGEKRSADELVTSLEKKLDSGEAGSNLNPTDESYAGPHLTCVPVTILELFKQ